MEILQNIAELGGCPTQADWRGLEGPRVEEIHFNSCELSSFRCKSDGIVLPITKLSYISSGHLSGGYGQHVEALRSMDMRECYDGQLLASVARTADIDFN